jgi:hypothetical protein
MWNSVLRPLAIRKRVSAYVCAESWQGICFLYIQITDYRLNPIDFLIIVHQVNLLEERQSGKLGTLAIWRWVSAHVSAAVWKSVRFAYIKITDFRFNPSVAFYRISHIESSVFVT